MKCTPNVWHSDTIQVDEVSQHPYKSLTCSLVLTEACTLSMHIQSFLFLVESTFTCRVHLQIQCLYLPPFSSSKDENQLMAWVCLDSIHYILCECCTGLYIYIAIIMLLFYKGANLPCLTGLQLAAFLQPFGMTCELRKC